MSITNEFTKELLVAIPEHFDTARVWRNNRVKTKAVGEGGRERYLDAGVDGQADISGIVGILWRKRLFGLRLEVEVKVGRDRQNTAQKDFQRMIESRGGIYVVAREREQLIQDLEAEIEKRSRDY